ncbi:ABC-2 transporter permease [Paenibacillus sanguinis]|uniref:ABC-2 transporter permease n=1 Tax=Paenibacillus sanguinis TaxID=225906 RepID=UPI0003771B1E|nr:ABC-2 transporter permease [Paenibacillus sanguinis]
MKSLILKDLYNIRHNAKSMLFILMVLAVALIPTSGVAEYIFACTILHSMMIMTTFSFDDHSKWTRYAMIMPVSRKDLVASKFIVLLVFSGIGSVVGLLIGTVGGMITSKLTFNLTSMYELLVLALTAWVVAMIFGGVSIPLVFKFGAEKARLLLLISFLIPAAICLGIYQLFSALGIVLTETYVFILLGCSPMIALLWDYMMFKISYQIFAHKEL